MTQTCYRVWNVLCKCTWRITDPLTIGAAASAFYINEAASILPKAVIAKVRTYLIGAATDAVEVS